MCLGSEAVSLTTLCVLSEAPSKEGYGNTPSRSPGKADLTYQLRIAGRCWGGGGGGGRKREGYDSGYAGRYYREAAKRH